MYLTPGHVLIGHAFLSSGLDLVIRQEKKPHRGSTSQCMIMFQRGPSLISRLPYLSQLEFGNHDWPWLITKNHHAKWNIFHDFWQSNFMILVMKMRSPKITKNVSFNMMTFGDFWWLLVIIDYFSWHLVIFGDFWWSLMIFHDKNWRFIMINHDTSWFIMTNHHPIGRDRSR